MEPETPDVKFPPIDDKLGRLCEEIRRVYRVRVDLLRARILLENNATAAVARTLGYRAGLEEDDRKKKFAEAEDLIKEVVEKGKDSDHPLRDLILGMAQSFLLFDKQKESLDKTLTKLAKGLPAAAWVQEKEQTGFGLLSLAIVVGECGDLRLYAGPYKLWRRLGCAPWTFEVHGEEKTLMGATWKSGREGKLPASEWEAFGYSPRRRSVAFLIGTNIKMMNKDGPYRKKYDEKKAQAAIDHPEWVACVCEGTGKNEKGKTCQGCLGKGKKMLRCDRHGMLLATKFLLKRLWNIWNGKHEDSNYARWIARMKYKIPEGVRK